jgi:YegS/Rv2252/BmrU family lipid kinase
MAGPRRRGGARARVALVERLLRVHRLDGEARVTEGPGHAAELARAAAAGGARAVCAWGGDGTMNEVACALAGSGVSLGLVPAGSGNGLARDLGLPVDPARALHVAFHGRERVIDMGELAGRRFVNVAGVGLDAAVAARFNRGGGGRRGIWRYAALAVREALRHRPCEYTIRLDGGAPRREPALLVVFANARQYGAGAVIAPAARPDDGQLDLVVVGARGALAALRGAPRLFRGTLDRAAGVRVATFREAEVAGAAPLALHVDGEPFAGGPELSVRVLAGALRVRVP